MTKQNVDFTPIGRTFSRWTIISFVRRTVHRDRYYICRCECGTEQEVNYKSMTRGLSTSCGCRRSEVTIARSTRHGANKRGQRSSEYNTWIGLQRRCNDPTNINYKNYGGRGIKVCDRWLNSFQNFLADMGTKSFPELTIERINNDGNYEPNNCKWATRLEQARNKRNTRKVV